MDSILGMVTDKVEQFLPGTKQQVTLRQLVFIHILEKGNNHSNLLFYYIATWPELMYCNVKLCHTYYLLFINNA